MSKVANRSVVFRVTPDENAIVVKVLQRALGTPYDLDFAPGDDARVQAVVRKCEQAALKFPVDK